MHAVWRMCPSCPWQRGAALTPASSGGTSLRWRPPGAWEPTTPERCPHASAPTPHMQTSCAMTPSTYSKLTPHQSSHFKCNSKCRFTLCMGVRIVRCGCATLAVARQSSMQSWCERALCLQDCSACNTDVGPARAGSDERAEHQQQRRQHAAQPAKRICCGRVGIILTCGKNSWCAPPPNALQYTTTELDASH